jgi:hypothetical protein
MVKIRICDGSAPVTTLNTHTHTHTKTREDSHTHTHTLELTDTAGLLYCFVRWHVAKSVPGPSFL